MKTYAPEELKEILKLHKEWLNNNDEGKRANLRGSNLRRSDLRGSNLSGSDLRGSDLRGSNLRGSNLSGSDLRDSNLSGSNLRGSNLRGSDLRGSDLRDSNLSDSNLSGSDLRRSDLRGSDLRGSNLRGSDLRGSNLRGSDLSDSNLSGSDLRDSNLSDAHVNENTAFFSLSCPEEGDFIGWKKCSNSTIVKLLITGKRSSATSRKCRCSEALVIEIIGGAKEVCSNYDSDFIYRSGETVSVSNFDENRWNECSSGIHFFITRAEAENY